MSTPSTPRSTRSASAANSPAMLTPGQKIKAMMAEFDSDSDSEGDKQTTKKPALPSHNSPKSKPNQNHTTAFTLDSDSDDNDKDNEVEDDDIFIPRGRMAARLQGLEFDNSREPARAEQPAESAFERVSKTLRAAKEGSDKAPRDSADDYNEAVSSDDDLPAAGPRRRVQKTRDADEEGRSRSRSRARSYSPLFMSPEKGQNATEEQGNGDNSDDGDAAPKRNNRFMELVAQKRKEREEKERAEAEKRAAKAKEREAANPDIFSDEEDENDNTSGRKESAQQPRPARKAGKKAMEEMNRETQRMSRNMQLAHEAKTKKKITKESFFARFDFMQPQGQNAPEQPADNSSTTAGSQNSSDVEVNKEKETPQTSPVLPPADKDDSTKELQAEEMNFPSLEEILDAPDEDIEEPIEDKAKDKAAKPVIKLSEVKKGKLPLRVAPARVRLSREQVARHQKDDSDDDLEIVTSPAKCRRIAAFENLPARQNKESASMFRLRALAQLTSPSRKSTMNSAELAASLLLQAKQQAGKERRERIEELRAKGIVIETAAERAAFEDEVENLVEKARQEGEDIAKEERAARKRENGGDGDDDDDSDFQMSGSEDEGQGQADLDDDDDEDDVEGDDEDEEMDDAAEAKKEGNLIDSEAGEDEGDDEDMESEDEAAAKPSAEEATEVPTQRRTRRTRVLSDDEDEEETEAPKTPAKPIHPLLNSVERPNIPVKPSEATMSLTQAFAGTLATSQDMSQEGGDTIPHSIPEPVPMSLDREPDSQFIVKDSQEQRAGSVDPFPGYWQPDARVSESPAARSVSQFSQFPEPTQDAGFVLSPFDPNKRFMGTPQSTIETVIVDQNRSPVAARHKNLRRGKAPQLSAVEEQEDEEGDFEINASAFDVLKKASKKDKKAAELFDRKKSKAKDVVEEAAEESDDEYAGLGGGSDDDADDEENALDRDMINDAGGEKVDAKQLAALNALHQRNADEKDVAKLLKDITTGALRRRRGNEDEFDLDDSDDEMLARRRQKQREFARMRNALLADGKVGELAENPKKAAFFKAIEDRDDDDAGLDFLGLEQEGATQEEPASQNGNAEGQDDQEESNKRKRPLEPSAEDVNNRPPPHMRRKPASAMSKKPATLAEIRETVSFLTERPEYDSFQEDASVEAEHGEGEEHADDDEAEEPPVTNREREPSVGFAHPRRTRGPVVDRLALLRQASSNSANTGSGTKMAFHTGAASDKAASFGFKPPMLRKSTTATSSTGSASDSNRGVTKAPGASVAKKGSVNYYTAARERERERQLRTQHRNRGSNITALLSKHAGNRLGDLGGAGQWD